jgi:hypothetical protein
MELTAYAMVVNVTIRRVSAVLVRKGVAEVGARSSVPATAEMAAIIPGPNPPYQELMSTTANRSVGPIREIKD